MANELIALPQMTQMLTKMQSQLKAVLPNSMSPERLARIALTELRMIPKLRECSPESFLKCLMVSAQLGLEPGLLGHVYFIPYGQEATVIVGYKGMLDLARRSGQILSIEPRIIYENDKVDIALGTESRIHHTVSLLGGNRGKPIAYYAVAKLAGGGVQFDIMTKNEIDTVRNASKAKNSGPWVTHYDEMAKKTVIRRLFKYLPVSIEMQKAIALDESQEVGTQSSVIDGELAVDIETGEVLNAPAEAVPTAQSDALADKIK